MLVVVLAEYQSHPLFPRLEATHLPVLALLPLHEDGPLRISALLQDLGGDLLRMSLPRVFALQNLFVVRHCERCMIEDAVVRRRNVAQWLWRELKVG